jgi:hypothetical protein
MGTTAVDVHVVNFMLECACPRSAAQVFFIPS